MTNPASDRLRELADAKLIFSDPPEANERDAALLRAVADLVECLMQYSADSGKSPMEVSESWIRVSNAYSRAEEIADD